MLRKYKNKLHLDEEEDVNVKDKRNIRKRKKLADYQNKYVGSNLEEALK
jgi:hypothetical protein